MHQSWDNRWETSLRPPGLADITPPETVGNMITASTDARCLFFYATVGIIQEAGVIHRSYHTGLYHTEFHTNGAYNGSV